MPDIPDNWKAILAIAALAIGLVAPGAINLTTPAARYKAFTTDDGDKLDHRITVLEWKDVDSMEERIMEVERYLVEEKQDCSSYRNKVELKFEAMEWRLRKDMPPAATQARIRACERWIEKTDLGWEPPTLKWQ